MSALAHVWNTDPATVQQRLDFGDVEPELVLGALIYARGLSGHLDHILARPSTVPVTTEEGLSNGLVRRSTSASSAEALMVMGGLGVPAKNLSELIGATGTGMELVDV